MDAELLRIVAEIYRAGKDDGRLDRDVTPQQLEIYVKRVRSIIEPTEARMRRTNDANPHE